MSSRSVLATEYLDCDGCLAAVRAALARECGPQPGDRFGCGIVSRVGDGEVTTAVWREVFAGTPPPCHAVRFCVLYDDAGESPAESFRWAPGGAVDALCE